MRLDHLLSREQGKEKGLGCAYCLILRERGSFIVP
ncbi:protein of unknown function [Kyrpidia spormannii]|uniref:Uncharacterized protein n=1 Tax=Kyrpidia spormannii TaxID=2055160 RepID=A0ACA8Z722_9BACL|nr:protein of unknown function [Kyrpidia spormannii]